MRGSQIKNIKYTLNYSKNRKLHYRIYISFCFYYYAQSN